MTKDNKESGLREFNFDYASGGISEFSIKKFDKTYKLVMGIDPGASGGIANYHEGRLTIVKMDRDVTKLMVYFKHMKETYTDILVVVEKQTVRPMDINGRQYRMQSLLNNFNNVLTVLKLNEIDFICVMPIEWQKYLNLKMKEKESDKARKNRYKLSAQTLYPMLKMNLWNADATLLMHFGRKKLQFEPGYVCGKLNLE